MLNAINAAGASAAGQDDMRQPVLLRKDVITPGRIGAKGVDLRR